MSTSTLIVVVVIAIAVVVGIAFLARKQRSQKLKSRFGPEYSRAVQETGSQTKAEAKLEKLQKRVERFKINPLSPADRAEFTATWQKIQARFVDDPRGALTEADQLIQRIMTNRGYPVTDFEQRAADISVDHPVVVEQYRAGHEISLRHAQGRASTEDMRQAMIHYRALFAELAESPEVTRPTASRAARA
jgi:FtsZ-interacting cell division protein ZipA